MKKFNYILLFALGIVIYVFVIGFRKSNIYPLYGKDTSSIIGFISMFFIAFFSLKEYGKGNKEKDNRHTNRAIMFCLWLGISIIEIPLRIIYRDIINGLPGYMYWCLGLGLGYCFWKFKSTRLRIIVISSSLILLILYQSISDCWLHYWYF